MPDHRVEMGLRTLLFSSCGDTQLGFESGFWLLANILLDDSIFSRAFLGICELGPKSVVNLADYRHCSCQESLDGCGASSTNLAKFSKFT